MFGGGYKTIIISGGSMQLNIVKVIIVITTSIIPTITPTLTIISHDDDDDCTDGSALICGKNHSKGEESTRVGRLCTSCNIFFEITIL